MLFTSPIALALLLPWGALVWWILRGRQRTRVPFVSLWRTTDAAPTPRLRQLTPPHPAVALILAAILLAILAAAGLSLRAARAARLTILLDRGITLSSPARWHDLIAQADHALRARFNSAEIELLSAPSHPAVSATLANWAALASALPATALNTRDELTAIVKRLNRQHADVILLSDQPIDGDFIRFAPPSAPRNAGISLLAARDKPSGEIAVRIVASTGPLPARLRITTNQRQLEQDITLPPPNSPTTSFIPLALGDTIEAELLIDDDIPADNKAFLIRSRRPARIELRGPASPQIARVVDAYRKARAAGDEGPLVAVGSPEQLSNEELAVLVGAPTEKAPGPLTITPHPITADLDLTGLGNIRAAPLPAGDWTILARTADKPLLALRSKPRQAWIGFDAPNFASSTAFVVLWTNILDFLGAGEGEYTSSPPHQLGASWSGSGLWPGIYKIAEGALCAITAAPPDGGTAASSPAGDLDKLAQRASSGARELSSTLLPLALACICAAVVLWPVHRPR